MKDDIERKLLLMRGPNLKAADTGQACAAQHLRRAADLLSQNTFKCLEGEAGIRQAQESIRLAMVLMEHARKRFAKQVDAFFDDIMNYGKKNGKTSPAVKKAVGRFHAKLNQVAIGA